MRKKFLAIFFVGITSMLASVSAQVVQRDGGATPFRTVTPDENGVTVSYNLDGLRYEEDDLYPGSYRIDGPGFGHNTTLSEPAYPLRWDSFEIPEGCSASVSVVSETDIDMPLVLAPARGLLVDSSTTGYTLDNVPPVEGFKGWSTVPLVSKDGVEVYRDRDILYVRVSPVSYSYEEGKVKLANEFSYRVSFDASGSAIRRSSGNRHDVDEGYLSSVLTFTQPTASPMNAAAAGTVWKDAPHYLILTVPAYAQAANTFKAWKQKMGFNVTVLSQSSWTSASIKSSISAQYQSQYNMQYVLLFGNEDALPGMAFSTNRGTRYTDYLYGCMDGDNDMMSDLFMGRISVTSLTEANTVVNKIIAYEKTPPTQTSFYNEAIGAAYFQDYETIDGYEDRRFVKTCEDIRTALMGKGITMSRIYKADSSVNPHFWNMGRYDYGGELPSDLKKPNFAWNGSKTDIISQINTGVLFALHRDHGAVSGWVDPSFTTSDLNSLNNGNLTPVVFSINCESGTYQGAAGYPVCFAEKFLSMQGGAVGVFAASAVSYSGCNDAMALEMFRCVWPDAGFPATFPSYSHIESGSMAQIATLGGILKTGVDRMAQYYTPSNPEYIPYTKKIFHCFGDPSMRMYSKRPNDVIASVQSSGKTSKGQQIIFTFNIPVNMSAVYQNGTVKVASGTQITLTCSNTDVPKVMVYGQDIRTSIMDSQITSLTTAGAAEIESVCQEGGMLQIKVRTPEQSSATLSLKSLDGYYSATKEVGDNSNAEFDVTGLNKGIYTVTLSVDGKDIETTKTILK